jgi:hypothetical protein
MSHVASPTDRDTDAAARRVEAFLRAIERTSIDDLLMLALPLPNPEIRRQQLEAVRSAAAAVGRDLLLAQARSRARSLIEDAIARRAYQPTWFGLNWGRSLGRSTDRAALVAAAENAAAAVVVEDVIDAPLLEQLAWPFQTAAAMSGAAPSTNPAVGVRRVGHRQRLLMLVLIGLTAGWLLVGEFIVSVLGWLDWEQRPPMIHF